MWRAGRVSVAGLVLACVLGLACLPVIVGGSLRGRAAYDSLNYHEKAVRQFAQELPTPNLRDYLSATTPAYHLTLAVVGRGVCGLGLDGEPAYDKNLTPAGGDGRIETERRALQWVALCFSLALLYVVGGWLESRLRGGDEGEGWCEGAAGAAGAVIGSVALCLPLVGSPYIYQSAAWLVPDNAGWLGVAVLLLLALRGRVTVGTLVFMGGVLVWLVAARQVHAWGAGLIWAAAWLRGSMERDRGLGGLLEMRDMLPAGGTGRIAGWMVIGLACAVPAAGVVCWFWNLWGGQLVPPTFTAWHGAGGGGVQWGTAAFVLSLIGLLSPFYGGWLWNGAERARRDHRGALVVGAVAGLVLAVVPLTGWTFEGGRFGGVWEVYRKVGTVGERSVAMLLLAPVGGVVVVCGLAGVASARRRWVLLAAIAGFVAANSFNPQLWQRYHEPFVLLWLAVVCGLSGGAAGFVPRLAAWRLGGPVVLACGLGVLSAWLILKTPPQVDEGYRLGRIETPPSRAGPGGE